MAPDTRVIRAYVDHFLPRGIVGPVLIVFSLEGVIDGLFALYVPEESATGGWAVIFLAAVVLVAYWGTVDEEAEELEQRLEEIEETTAQS
ncbi:MAG: hypothetical protein ACOC0X_01945 [Halobacteriota archaeon]